MDEQWKPEAIKQLVEFYRRYSTTSKITGLDKPVIDGQGGAYCTQKEEPMKEELSDFGSRAVIYTEITRLLQQFQDAGSPHRQEYIRLLADIIRECTERIHRYA